LIVLTSAIWNCRAVTFLLLHEPRVQYS
jgi:hypothetical protein